MTENSIGNLEKEALKRKERLAQLKRKAQGDKDVNGVGSNAPKKTFRNYKSDAETVDGEKIDTSVVMDVVEAQVSDQLEAMKSHIVIEEIDITNLAPRKPDWDLKRDVAKKLETLERRTQKAIAELIRERLKGGNEVLDMAQAVNVGTAGGGSKLVLEED